MSARASAIFTISDGVDPLISVSDNGPGDQSPMTGTILVQTNVGVWNLVINIAVTKPVFGSATDPVMDINLQAESTAAGSLTMSFSDNNFGPATGTLNASTTGMTVSGATGLAGLSVYGDPGNNILALTDLITSTPLTPLSPNSDTSSGALTLGAPYSLTEILQIGANGATFVNVDASFNVSSVPEPSIPALGALGVAAWTLLRMRRRA
jgi:hypothetical protein